MANYNDIYTSKYGTNEKMLLRSLGGDPDAIISNYPASGEWPFGGLICGDFPDDADNIHNMVIAEIEKLYFTGITRETAVAICNTLSMGLGFGTIKISASLDKEYNAWEFMGCWNSNHSEEEKIFPPVSLDI